MFITEPAELASFREELVFEYSQEESSDLLFEIELGEDVESREVKKLYDTQEATINIAPVVANQFMTEPSSGESRIEIPSSGYGLVTLRCGEISSSSRYFVAAKTELPTQGVVSTMPNRRFISYGESEEIWVRAEEGTTIGVRVETLNNMGETTTTLFEQCSGECGLLRFRFNTADFEEHNVSVRLHVLCDEEQIGELCYIYTPKISTAIRLAWIGDMGGIEHYTFPRTTSAKRLKSGVSEYEVESAYESAAVIDALTEILSSPSLWMVEGEEYYQVQLLSESVELNYSGELSTVAYKFERYD